MPPHRTQMNNLSSALVSDPSPTAAAIDDAARWARQSLTVATSSRKEADKTRGGRSVPLPEREDHECEMVAVVGAFNLGRLSEVSCRRSGGGLSADVGMLMEGVNGLGTQLAKDRKSAKAWFEKALQQSVRIGSREGVEQARDALRRL